MNKLSQVILLCRITLLLVSVTLVLAACGEQTTVPPVANSLVNTPIVGTPLVNPIATKPGATSSTPGQIQACDLVIQKEADEALGSPSEKHENVLGGNTGFSACDYKVNDSKGKITISLGTKGADVIFTSNKAEQQSVEVAGLGDRAFKYSKNEGTTLVLVVQKGNNLCQIKLEDLADSDTKATALMKKAIERLSK